ncbi:MAG: PfkB family carbohydrate kinase, partial [Spirochaetota bacterium]|nr:PfkB family carbohydrate kinase [Spirochaetota bacterium]
AMISHAGRVRHWNAHNVKAVDTTAAGDSFIGAFAASLMEGRSPEEAVEVAIFASAITVTRHGAQSSLPIRSEVEEAMAEWR